jgi:heme exporter protein A
MPQLGELAITSAEGSPSGAAQVSRPAAVVELDGIARRFGVQWPLRGVSLSVGPGEGVALMGRNGSGKTTLLRILSTALRPTRGTGRILGHDLVAESDSVRARTGVLSHAPALYLDLSPRENLQFAQRMHGGPVDMATIDGALERVALAGYADERVRHFSSGMMRRVSLARLLLREYAVILLDEPYASFDADGIALLDEIANAARARGATVIVATHDPARARAMADRVVLMEKRMLREVSWAEASRGVVA